MGNEHITLYTPSNGDENESSVSTVSAEPLPIDGADQMRIGLEAISNATNSILLDFEEEKDDAVLRYGIDGMRRILADCDEINNKIDRLAGTLKVIYREAVVVVASDAGIIKKPRKKRAKTAKTAKPHTLAAPKYKDQDTGETWGGRGRKPLWLTRKIEAGYTLEDFKL